MFGFVGIVGFGDFGLFFFFMCSRCVILFCSALVNFCFFKEEGKVKSWLAVF